MCWKAAELPLELDVLLVEAPQLRLSIEQGLDELFVLLLHRRSRPDDRRKLVHRPKWLVNASTGRGGSAGGWRGIGGPDVAWLERRPAATTRPPPGARAPSAATTPPRGDGPRRRADDRRDGRERVGVRLGGVADEDARPTAAEPPGRRARSASSGRVARGHRRPLDAEAARRRPRACGHRAPRTRCSRRAASATCASASSVGTADQRERRRRDARPLAKPSAMRRPVNDPGPIETATASRSAMAKPGRGERRRSTSAAGPPRARAASGARPRAAPRRRGRRRRGRPGRGVDAEDDQTASALHQRDGCRCRRRTPSA